MSLSARPSISVVIPVYNAVRCFPSAIESIVRQNYEPLEIIVVNDGSTDGTKALLADQSSSIVNLEQVNQGPASARNTGIQASNGDLIAFLDQDDVWLPHHLELLLDAFIDDPTIDFSHGNVRIVEYKDGDLDGSGLVRSESSAQFLLGAGLFRRALFDRVGMFDVSLRTADDLDWFDRCRQQRVRSTQIADNVLEFRRHGSSLMECDPDPMADRLQMLRKSIRRQRSSESVIEPQ